MMPPKALNVLANIKTSLLSKQQAPEPDVIVTVKPPKRIGKLWMRRAPRPNAYQRMMQRGDKW